MIPNFKAYINESVWSDIHKRSNGTSIRKEDNIDQFEYTDFCEYIKNTYIPTTNRFDIHDFPSMKNPAIMCIQMSIYNAAENGYPITIYYQTKTSLYYSFDVEKPMYVRISGHIIKDYPELVDQLNKNYKAEQVIRNQNSKSTVPTYEVNSKSGSLKNSDCINIIDICLNTIKNPLFIKKS